MLNIDITKQIIGFSSLEDLIILENKYDYFVDGVSDNERLQIIAIRNDIRQKIEELREHNVSKAE